MADTRRTWAALAALYADNTAGAISPQDLRDGFKSLQPHVTSSAPDENDDETSGFDTDHAWIDTSTDPVSLYRCLNASTGAAVWAKVYPASAGSVALDDLTDVDTSGSSIGDVLADTGSGWAPLTLATVATSGSYDDLTGTPTLGTAAAADTGDFATAAQGALADTAVQPAAIADFVTGDGITDIVAVTQAEYDGLTPDATTLYVITDA